MRLRLSQPQAGLGLGLSLAKRDVSFIPFPQFFKQHQLSLNTKYQKKKTMKQNLFADAFQPSNGALTHHLQSPKWLPEVPKWQMGSTPRFLSTPANFGKIRLLI